MILLIKILNLLHVNKLVILFFFGYLCSDFVPTFCNHCRQWRPLLGLSTTDVKKDFSTCQLLSVVGGSQFVSIIAVDSDNLIATGCGYHIQGIRAWFWICIPYCFKTEQRHRNNVSKKDNLT